MYSGSNKCYELHLLLYEMEIKFKSLYSISGQERVNQILIIRLVVQKFCIFFIKNATLLT